MYCQVGLFVFVSRKLSISVAEKQPDSTRTKNMLQSFTCFILCSMNSPEWIWCRLVVAILAFSVFSSWIRENSEVFLNLFEHVRVKGPVGVNFISQDVDLLRCHASPFAMPLQPRFGDLLFM